MNEFLFLAGNVLAMASWGLLILVPRWRGVAQTVATTVAPVLLSVAYSALIGVWWSRAQGGFSSLDEVHALFQTRGALVAGWLHYLAFDLLMGAWIAREFRQERIPHAVVIPVLILTFLFGPMGYLASLTVRAAWRLGTTRSGQETEHGRFMRALRRVAGREPRLMAAAFLCFAMIIPIAVAAAMDDRTLGGVNVWLKPLKFLISTGLFLATLGFFMPMSGDAFRRSASGCFVVWGAIATSLFELVYIVWRASRGEASHFNTSTPQAEILYGLMGIAAIILAATGPVLAWGIARSDAQPADPTYRLAVVLGLILTFALGATSGAVVSVGPGHFVGSATASDPGLPLVGWSRKVGDLRVPHFMGLHAQQVLAIFGFLAAGFQRGRGMVIGFACCYSIVVIGLFLQALAGHPLLPG
ncbi:MAG: ABA4-like family protein [Planctomycetaceae bacterium]